MLSTRLSVILMIAMSEITAIVDIHIPSFREAVDVVALEKQYLTFLEAPTMESTRAFIMNDIQYRHPQFVALDTNSVIGWCDIIPNPFSYRIGGRYR